MMLYETLKLALQAIRRNALRSSLTVLGIVIGVGAVIAMVTIGNGTTVKVSADLAKLGTNLLIARPGQMGPGRPSSDARPFSMRDVEGLRTQLTSVRAVTPVASKTLTVVRGTESRSTTVAGTDTQFFVSQSWNLATGHQFAEGDVRGGTATCILGETVREELFGSFDPVGQSIRVGKIACDVIGLLEAKGQTSFGMDQDDLVLVPLRTFQRRIAGNSDVTTIYVSAAEGADTASVQADMERLLRERRNIAPDEEDDFSVRDLKEIIEAQTATTAVLTGLLGAVASVSLLVGGIGIMNIMLVSVTERTREIGIRLAIGALGRQVMTQFLVEAAVLSLFGGMIGIVAGLVLAKLAAEGLGVPYILDPAIIVIAFGFSALVGVIFGFFPARRAARLDPIEALRHE